MTSQPSVCYCVNPRCLARQNPLDQQVCQSCQTALLVNDRYRLTVPLRALESVGNAELFEVEDLDPHQDSWGTTKVLKILSHSTSREWIRLFKQEARALIWLNHPGVPKVEPDGYFTIALPRGNKPLHCLVMEKVDGQNLEQCLSQGKITQERAIDWLTQLATILQQVHRYDLLHRDIKPSNIMMKPDGQLVLIDFGTVSSLDRGLTAVSSFGYTAPEQGQGRAAVQSDLFSLGRTIVHLLTGIHPCDLPADAMTGDLIWRDSVPQIDDWLADLLDRLMAQVPRQRPSDAQRLLQELALREGTQPLLPNRVLPETRLFDWRSRLWLRYGQPGIFLLIASGVVVGGYGVSRWANDAGVAAHLEDRFPQAQSLYGWALRLNSQSAIAHYNQATLAEDRQDFDSAIDHYRLTMTDEKHAAAATNNLARLYILHRKDYAAAVNLIVPSLTTVKNSETHYSLLKNLAWARYQQHRYAEAQMHLQQAISLKGDRAAAYCLMAQVLEAQTNSQGAISQWEKCLGLASSHNRDEDVWIGMAKQRLDPSAK